MVPKHLPSHYLSEKQYQLAEESAHVLNGMILFEFARAERGERDLIIRNFVARGDTILRGVFRLWKIRDYHDCWVLYRCLVDRVFHLFSLTEKDEFEDFDAWSFMRQYEALQRVRNDPTLTGIRDSPSFAITREQREKYRRLSAKPPKWRRPRAKQVAKRMKLDFLYAYGYDFASAHVHPMANDGHEDFFTITGLEPKPDFPDWRSALSNSLLAMTVLMQQALNSSTFSWRRAVYEAVDGLQRYTDSGDHSHLTPLRVVSVMFGGQEPLSASVRP